MRRHWKDVFARGIAKGRHEEACRAITDLAAKWTKQFALLKEKFQAVVIAQKRFDARVQKERERLSTLNSQLTTKEPDRWNCPN